MKIYIKAFFAALIVFGLAFSYSRFLSERFLPSDFQYAFLYALFTAFFSAGYLFFRIKPTYKIIFLSFIGNYLTGHIFIFYLSESAYRSPSLMQLIFGGLESVFVPQAIIMGGLFFIPQALFFSFCVGRAFQEDFNFLENPVLS